MKQNIEPLGFPELAWNSDDTVRRSLAELRQYAERAAVEAAAWYLSHKQMHSYVARGLRASAIVLTTLGGVVPVMAAMGAPKAADWSHTGYVLLGLAAGCVAMDRFFGFSNGWIRYVTTAMVLQRLLAEFQFDWTLLMADLPAGPLPAVQKNGMLRRLEAFVLQVRREVERETAEWASEYRSNLTEVGRSARAQLDALRPGRIDLAIADAAELTNVTVLLDEREYGTITTERCQVAPVLPGAHVIGVTAKDMDGRLYTASSTVAVVSGQSATLTLKPKAAPT